MQLESIKLDQQKGSAGFSLAELLISFFIFAMVVGGVIYGYVQANHAADYTAMSTAASSMALQGAERARAARWNWTAWPMTYGAGNADELGTSNGLPTTPVLITVDYMDIPSKGTPDQTNFNLWVTNNIYVTDISSNPHLRMIRSDAIWTYYSANTLITNTVMDMRAPDQ